ncbi:MAG: aminodeoxychorismate lyase [Eubacteriales bacterium]|jgi:cell division protein YceG involved in septum cleavage
MSDRDREQESLGYRIAIGGIRGVLYILVLIALVVLLIFIARKAYTLGYEVFDEEPVDTGEGRAVTVTITDDMSVRQIGMLLRSEGLLTESVEAFQIQELISEYHGDILPGTYTLRTSMTADDMFPILAQEVPDEDDSGSSSASSG